MKTHLLLIATLALLTAPLLRAADHVGINTLAADPSAYAGREITITGHVDRISAARRMVVLIDASEATCNDGCDRKTLLVELPAESPLPTKGQTLTASGKLSSGTPPLRLAATRATIGG